jgi:cytochrome c-type protein NapB
MKSIILAGLALTLAAGMALAQSQGVVSLRGAVGITETNQAPVTHEQSKPAMGFGRAYRQQPPLIPHRVEGYQVNRAFNKCLSCHGWPQYAQFGAPKVSETHYQTREGVKLDEVTPSRWFCTQCHVPQAAAPALVPNAFRNASEIGGAFN